MRTTAAVLVLAGAAAASPGAQPPPLADVLARAARYVAGYEKQLQGVVAEETYSQNVTWNEGGNLRSLPRVARETRRLRSDVLLVKLGDEDTWLQFRDVFEVDRKPVRDRDQRLYKLFVESSNRDDARRMAKAIQEESARYNIGPLLRTVNVPILGLLFFDAVVQTRVKFTEHDSTYMKAFEGVAARENVCVLEYEEKGPGTMVRGLNDLDLPSHGRVWLDRSNGRILRTEMITEDIQLRALIDVTYRAEPGLDLLVPGQMRETYNLKSRNTRIDGLATYSRFRQFKVSTDEKTEKPKP